MDQTRQYQTLSGTEEMTEKEMLIEEKKKVRRYPSRAKKMPNQEVLKDKVVDRKKCRAVAEKEEQREEGGIRKRKSKNIEQM